MADWIGFGYTSAAPFFVCLGLLFLVADTALFQAADSPPSAVRHRVRSLDGLRGILALAVVFHHIAIYHGYLQTGRWTLPPTQFYALLGPLGVSMFFMITGYLFWGRLVRDSGRMNWAQLYTGRVFRIGPLFVFAVLMMFGVVLLHTGAHLLVSPRALIRQTGTWLSLGLLLGRSVNGWDQADLVLAGVTWSIQWEWIFYLCLPVMALVARKPRAQVPWLLGLLGATVAFRLRFAGHWTSLIPFTYGDLFLVGMLSASLAKKWLGKVPDWAGSCVLVVCLVWAAWKPQPYSLRELAGLGAAFYLVSSGCTLFGLLVTRSARRLGDISYGIYLLQGLALAMLYRPAALRTFALSSPLHHWMLGLAGCLVLVSMATAAHVWIERPGIALGRWVSDRWTARGPAGG